MTQQFHCWVYIQNKQTKKNLIHKDTCALMFTIMLFKIAKIRKQLKHLPMNE